MGHAGVGGTEYNLANLANKNTQFNNSVQHTSGGGGGHTSVGHTSVGHASVGDTGGGGGGGGVRV